MVYASSTNDWRCQSWSSPSESDGWNTEWGSLEGGANAPSWKDSARNASAEPWSAKSSWKSSSQYTQQRTSLRSSAEPWSAKSTWGSWHEPSGQSQQLQQKAFYCVPGVYVLTGMPGYVPNLSPSAAASLAAGGYIAAQRAHAEEQPIVVSTAAQVQESPTAERVDVSRPATPACNEEGDKVNVQCAPCEPPTDPSDLPSIGSAGHFDGSCKRCAFFPKGRCRNGKDCTHCHYDHMPRSRLRKRDPSRARCKDASIPDEPTSDTESPPSDDPCLSEPDLTSATESPGGLDIESASHDSEVTLDEAIYSKAEESIPECSDDSLPPTQTSTEESTLLPKQVLVNEQSDDATEVETAGASSSVSEDEALLRTSSDPCPEQPSASRRGVLETSPKSWAAMQKLRKQARAKTEGSVADVGRSARALLNKLTEERFESLCNQLLALPLSTSEQLETLAAEIFEKATTQNSFRAMYTELCIRFDAHLGERSDPAVGGKAFRKALANACQASFERHLHSSENAINEELPADEKLELEIKLKEQRLGNMRFIGELLTRRLLAPKLMLPIVHELQDSDEMALESLIALLTIIAPSFEQEGSLYKAPLRDAFATLRKRQDDKSLSLRLRCQLADLFEARARKWAPRSPGRQP